MWWDSQNLDQSRTSKSGEKWNFRVSHNAFTLQRTLSVARIFFGMDRDDGAPELTLCDSVLVAPPSGMVG